MMKGSSPRRRHWLLGTALLLVLFDGWFVWRKVQPDPLLSWTVRMPELERYQTEHPDNPLYTSEFWDPRVPPASIIDPAFSPDRPDMVRDLLSCRPVKLLLDVDFAAADRQVPARFYLSGSDASLMECARSRLPAGYVIENGIAARL